MSKTSSADSQWLSVLWHKVARVPRYILLVPIRLYQWLISPLLPPSCRFYPSCSRYSYEAVDRYGLLKGGALSARRILKCHPFHPGGNDPVP